MSIIVTDTGFGPDTWNGTWPDTLADTLADTSTGATSLDLPSDTDPLTVVDQLASLKMIRVDFPNSADGRGFTIARQLRLRGFKGRLRARGHVLADQYAMARRAGFDEVEIDEDLAARQPEKQWLFRANWRDNDYQSRLRG